MIYEVPVRVRYSETDEEGFVNLHRILDYFQDCCIFQSESLGYPVREERERNRGWFLLAWDVKIDRYPCLGEELCILTEPYKMKGFYGYRRFRMTDADGICIASADSLWLLMDLEKMLPRRVPQDMTEAYVRDVEDDRSRVKRKLPAEGDWCEADRIVVRKHFLDSNSHVNNTFYAMWAEECLPEGVRPRGLKIDYRQSAFENDVLIVDRIMEEGKIRCRFRNQDETLLCLVELYE